ncbi:unnamed protein product [Onchocerca ochengi]|uniref:Type II restriction endonuclease n=1 Tax=Onchocerca ochengi TaxID=42157 RepID=A0A182EXL5_ONCOC|nr:unnamed protein product [Onchocerca ochengi]
MRNGGIEVELRNPQLVPNRQAVMLAAYFTLCQNDALAKTLLYSLVPTHYTWNASRKSFGRRKRGEPVDGLSGSVFDLATIVERDKISTLSNTMGNITE